MEKTRFTKRMGIYFDPTKYLKLRIKLLEKGFKSVSQWIDVKIDELLKD